MARPEEGQVRNSEGYGLVGFPQKAGDALIKASTKFRPPRAPRASRLPNPRAPKIPKAKGVSTRRLY